MASGIEAAAPIADYPDDSLAGQIRRSSSLAERLAVAIDELKGTLKPIARDQPEQGNALATAARSTKHTQDLSAALDSIEVYISDLCNLTSRLDV